MKLQRRRENVVLKLSKSFVILKSKLISNFNGIRALLLARELLMDSTNSKFIAGVLRQVYAFVTKVGTFSISV